MKNAIEELVEVRDLIKRNADVSLVAAAMIAVVSNDWIATPDLDNHGTEYNTFRHGTTFVVIWSDGTIARY